MTLECLMVFCFVGFCLSVVTACLENPDQCGQRGYRQLFCASVHHAILPAVVAVVELCCVFQQL